MKISPARAAAFDILLKIERDRAFSSILLPEHESGLSEIDRPLCHRIVLGVLRKQITLDAAIRNLAGDKRLDVEVKIALRVGLYQLFELDRIPEHSAVNESVQLVQRAKKSSAKGFVNALLRRAIREGVTGHIEGETVAIATSHPEWLIGRWTAQFGADRAASIAEANNRPPKLSFRLTQKGIKEDAKLPNDVLKSEIAAGAFTVERMTPLLRQMAESGLIYFQDEASQLVGKVAALKNPRAVFDVCAAPGSKTSLIATDLTDSGAVVVAGDIHQKRADYLAENCRNQGLNNVVVLRYDAERSLPFGENTFDTVLVDAPCSGTGTIRANPEIRYFLRPEDFGELQKKQLRILTNASKTVAAGGRLIYSTCSLERDENEEIIADFLSRNEHFQPVADALPERFQTKEGFGRTFPDRNGTDGFFIAVLHKR